MDEDLPPGSVRPVRIDPSGLAGPTRSQVRRGWRPTTYGFHVPASVTDDLPAQRILEQSMRLGPGGAVSGWASLFLHGASALRGLASDGVSRQPVLLVSPDRQLRRKPGSRICADRIPEEDRIRRYGIWCTRPERAVFDEMRRHDFYGAVEVVDKACCAELTSLRRMRRYVELRHQRAGSLAAELALGYADERSWSGQETQSRMVWVCEAGLERPLCNRPVFDLDGRLLGVPDLLDPVVGLVSEYDGSHHRERDRRSKDLSREEALRSHGLDYFTIVAAHLHDRPGLARRMRAVHQRAVASLEVRVPQWTLVPPVGWRPFPWETDLDRRVALRAARAGWPPSPYA